MISPLFRAPHRRMNFATHTSMRATGARTVHSHSPSENVHCATQGQQQFASGSTAGQQQRQHGEDWCSARMQFRLEGGDRRSSWRHIRIRFCFLSNHFILLLLELHLLCFPIFAFISLIDSWLRKRDSEKIRGECCGWLYWAREFGSRWFAEPRERVCARIYYIVPLLRLLVGNARESWAWTGLRRDQRRLEFHRIDFLSWTAS